MVTVSLFGLIPGAEHLPASGSGLHSLDVGFLLVWAIVFFSGRSVQGPASPAFLPSFFSICFLSSVLSWNSFLLSGGRGAGRREGRATGKLPWACACFSPLSAKRLPLAPELGQNLPGIPAALLPSLRLVPGLGDDSSCKGGSHITFMAWLGTGGPFPLHPPFYLYSELQGQSPLGIALWALITILGCYEPSTHRDLSFSNNSWISYDIYRSVWTQRCMYVCCTQE